MELLTMLQNAKIRDIDGNDMGDVIGVCIFAGKMVITSNADLTDLVGDDGGSREDIPVGDNVIVLDSEVRESYAATRK